MTRFEAVKRLAKTESAVEQAARLLAGATGRVPDAGLREAAWVARCVGRGDTAPLRADDLAALATLLSSRRFADGEVAFSAGSQADGVWIVREGALELSVGSGRRRAVVQVLRPGDVDGDIALLLDRPLAYTARAAHPATCLYLARTDFDRLLETRPAIARRWLSSVAGRLAHSHARILGLLGRSLAAQTAQLLLDEAVDGQVTFPQRTLAAMLGAQRPSLNKVLKELEAAGLIRIRYAAIEILDPAALGRRADR